MSGGFHSDDYADAVLDLWAAGESACEIAEQLGDPLTEMRVKRLVARMRRNGDPRAGSRPKKTTWTEERRTQVADLVEAGLTVRGIAAEMGCSEGQVIGYIWRNGLRLARLPNQGTSKPKAAKLIATKPHKPKPLDRTLMPKFKPIVQPKAVVIEKAEPIDMTMPEPPANRIGVMDLKSSSCRFPIGNPGTASFTFCGSNAAAGKPYCASHVRLCYAGRPRG